MLADAAHALGQVRLDLRALEAAGVTHFMADAHKWLYSPKGSAMLWVTREAQASMYPSVVGAVCSNSRTTNFDPAALANLSEFERRFQYTGTRDYTPLVAVADALRWREKVGESAILGYNHSLAVWGQEFWHPSGTPRRSCRSARRSWRTRACQSRHPARRRTWNRRLREERATHAGWRLSFPRARTWRTEPTRRVRRCAQLFVAGGESRRRRWLADGGGRAACAWLARTRARLMRERALERAEEAALAAEAAAAGGRARARGTPTAAGEVAPASVPHISGSGSFGAGARTDSAFDLAAVEAVAKYSAGALGTPNAAAKAAHRPTTSVSEESSPLAVAVNYGSAVVGFLEPAVGRVPARARRGGRRVRCGRETRRARAGKGAGAAAASPSPSSTSPARRRRLRSATPREGSV